MVSNIGAPAWHTDVHTHFHTYNQALRNCLSTHCPKNSSGPKKSFITEEIWNLRSQKLACKKQLSAVGRRLKSETLRAFFCLWTASVGTRDPQNESASGHQQYFATMHCWRLKLGIRLSTLAVRMRRQLQSARKQALANSCKSFQQLRRPT